MGTLLLNLKCDQMDCIWTWCAKGHLQTLEHTSESLHLREPSSRMQKYLHPRPQHTYLPQALTFPLILPENLLMPLTDAS